VSFWIPGFFGSLAAVPQQQPGWSLTNVFYNTSVKAGGDVALAREFEIGGVPLTFSGTASASPNQEDDHGARESGVVPAIISQHADG
jgi:hypothetical protein